MAISANGLRDRKIYTKTHDPIAENVNDNFCKWSSGPENLHKNSGPNRRNRQWQFLQMVFGTGEFTQKLPTQSQKSSMAISANGLRDQKIYTKTPDPIAEIANGNFCKWSSE